MTSGTATPNNTSGGATTGGGGTTGGSVTGIAAGGASIGSDTTAGGTVGAAGLGGGAMGRGVPAPSTPLVRLRDVARVELGAQNYNLGCTFDGKPSVGLAIFQLPGTNALDVADRVKQKLEELKARFPDGVDYQIAYDTTPYIRESVMDVVRTLIEAVVLVAVVVLLFLQNWRAALIPLIAVPVAIIGTFAVMAALGFSLNNLSLFGLVLAVGIVVDDAIVVVENVERWLGHGLQPREAARRAMGEVTGPVIAVALVLCAVFVPCAFLGGVTGQFFRQFAVTLAVSTVFSAFNSLTLSPALAAILLEKGGSKRDPLTWLLDVSLGWFFRLFNWTFSAGTALYTRLVGWLLRLSVVVLLVYGGLLFLTYAEMVRVPKGFIPQQDKGYLMLNVQLPDSASVERTRRVMAHIEKIAHDTPGVEHTVAISGQYPRAARVVQQLAGQHPLAAPGDRPRQVHGAGGAGQRRGQHAAGLPGQLLRQQLQRVRPNLAGQHPGRAPLPRPGARHPRVPGAERPRRDGRAGNAAARPQHQRPGGGHELQPVRRRGGHRRHGAGHQPQPGRFPHGADRQEEVAPVDGLRLDGVDVPAEPDGEHGDLRVRAGGGVRVPGAGGAV
jgi:multidrug efflux pump subunit AcrB